MRYLVTGGAGFIGSHLVNRLMAEGHEVTILDNLSADSERNLSEIQGAFLVRGDLRDQETVNYAVRYADFVYHLAARINVDESLMFPQMYNEINVNGTLNLLKAVEGKHIPLVHMSTSEVYGTALTIPMNEDHPLNPHSPYAASKLAAERYVNAYFKSFGTKAMIVRSFNNYGPRQKGNLHYGGLISSNLVRVLCGERPIIRGGSQKRDYMFVEDTADALYMLRDFPDDVSGKVFNIGIGTSYTAEDLVSMIQAACGTDYEPIHQPSRPGDVLDLVAGTKAFRDRFGWRAQNEIEVGLAKSAQWYKKNLKRYSLPTFVTNRQEIGSE